MRLEPLISVSTSASFVDFHCSTLRISSVFEVLGGEVSLRANDVARQLRGAIGRGDRARQLEAGHLLARRSPSRRMLLLCTHGGLV